MDSLSNYIILSMFLFMIGLAGVLIRKNIIIIMVSIEIMLNAVNLSFAAFNRFKFISSQDGMMYSFFTIAIAAAEAAVGLAIVIAVYRKKKSVLTNDVNMMKN